MKNIFFWCKNASASTNVSTSIEGSMGAKPHVDLDPTTLLILRYYGADMINLCVMT